MYLDKQNEFSDSQLITTSAISTNVIDTGAGAAVKNLGGDAGLFLVVQVDVALTGGTSLAASLESDSTANLATSPTVHASTGAIPAASLTAGATLAVMPLPFGDYERYMGVRYTVVGTFAAGSVSAFLTRTPQRWTSYPNAI